MADDPIDVFVSSTCYDLIDLRSALHAHLKAQQFIVRFSDAIDSDFEVPGTVDSIATCLSNVSASRAVVCVMDRRYGPKLPAEYGGVSATHAEVLEAKRLNKPVFIFVRNRAWDEYNGTLKTDPALPTKWVEPGAGDQSIERRRLWTDFMDQLAKLPGHAPGSNWCDVFRDATELAPMVVKRLIHKFPEYAGTLAMRHDRMVRMTYMYATHCNSWVGGKFRNLGLGSALEIRHGVCAGIAHAPGTKDLAAKALGGLLEGELTRSDVHPEVYDLRAWPDQALKLFCEYRNRFGDRYRIEVPIRWRRDGYFIDSPEELYVRHGDQWHRP